MKNVVPKQGTAFSNNYAAAIIALFFLSVSFSSFAQTLQNPTLYGNRDSRRVVDSAMGGPTGCGAPVGLKIASIKASDNLHYFQYFDSCNHRFYLYDPKLATWDTIRVGATASAGWGLSGNAGTNPSTNFIGTTDLRDLTLKTNNIERLRAFSGGSVRVKDTLQTNYLKPASDTTADYEIVVLPDIQGMTYFHPDQLYSIGDWIKTNAVTNNIKAVLALGDLTDNSESFEWLRVDTLFKKIDSANIPYFPLIGNHDYDAGDITSARLTTEYNTWFGTSRFAGKSWYGNALNDLTENSYIKFNVGETKYLVIGLEVFPKDSSLDWAGRVVDSFPEYKTIIITHAYMSSYGELSNDTTFLGTITYSSMAGNNGQAMWDKFVKKHKNIMLVMNGHFINNVIGDHTYSQHFSKVGDYGNEVRQIMVNYQRKDNGGGYNNGGGGYFMRLRFSPANNKVYVSYYSSFYNTFDPDRDSFDLDVPNVQVNSTLSLKRGLLVREDVTVNGGIYSSLPQYSLPYIGINGKIRDTGFLNFKGGIVTVPKLKSNVTGNDTLAAPFSTSTITAMENNNDAGVKVLVGASAYDTRPLFFSNRSRGTINSPSNVQNGDFLMGIVAGGVYGGAVAYSAGLEFVVDGTPTSSTNVPGAIDFKTGTYGGNRTTQMRIKSDGKIGLGILTPAAKLDIAAGSTSLSPLHFTAGAPTTSLSAGNVMFNTGLLILDSTSSHRDTLATRNYVRNNSSGGGSSTITNGSTAMSGFTNLYIPYNNGGTVGQYNVSGTGNVAMTTSPSLTTPSLGVASATSINKMAITAPATSSTLAIADGKTFTVNNTITLAGTDSRVYTFPTTNATIARTDAANTFTGIQTMTSPATTTSITTASTSFTAWAGATTLLTIGGTGASASLFAPSTLDASSSITGAIRTSGGISAAKALNIGTTITAGTSINVAGVAVPTISSTSTLTNKRWTARVGSTTSSATPTINTDDYDIYKLTALAADITSFTTNLSGTAFDGDILEIQITDDGTARAITWGASFVSSSVTLPATTTISTTLTVIFQYYTTSSYGNNKWVCVNYF